mgnify:FL=1
MSAAPRNVRSAKRSGRTSPSAPSALSTVSARRRSGRFAAPRPGDTRHLLWLRERLGERLADAVVITTGRHAYRDEDDVAVVPAALLGP